MCRCTAWTATPTRRHSPGDFVLLTDQFVGGGDLIATSRLTAMLTRLHRPYRVKVGNDVSFQDLRIGAGDSGGLFLHAVERDQQPDALFHRGIAHAGGHHR